MTAAATTSIPSAKSPLVSLCPLTPLDLRDCRRQIERAAELKIANDVATSLRKNKRMTIRECLAAAGVDAIQASNKTMQARVRREVKRILSVGHAASTSTRSRRPPTEISIPTRALLVSSSMNDENDEFDSQINAIFCDSEVVEEDEVSVLSDATYFQAYFKQFPLAPLRTTGIVPKLRFSCSRLSNHNNNIAAPPSPQLKLSTAIQAARTVPVPAAFHPQDTSFLTMPAPPAISTTTTTTTGTMISPASYKMHKTIDFALDAANEWLESKAMIAA